MTQRFVVALTAKARKANHVIDLEHEIVEKFDGRVHIVERAESGGMVTVEIQRGMLPQLRASLPYALVEPEVAVSLL